MRRWKHKCKPYIKVLDRQVNEFGLSKREQNFVDMFKRIAAEQGASWDSLVKAAIASSGNLSVYGPDKEKLQKLRGNARARRLIARKPVAEAIQTLYAERGFTLADAFDMHIKHIMGTAPEGANYTALKDFEAMTLPQQAKQVNIKQQSAIAHFNVQPSEGERLGPPPMAPRSIGPAKVERDDA